MKTNLFFIAFFWLYSGSLFAQTSTQVYDTTQIRSIELGEVVVKNTEPDKFRNKVRSQNAFIVLNPTSTDHPDRQMDSLYFVTYFPQPEAEPISLYAVELKLKSYDTSMFDIKLLIYQANAANDTIYKEIPIDGSKIAKNGKLRVTLFDEAITLQPGCFYIGYGFKTKNIQEPYHYRMYASNKGEGAIINFRGGKTEIARNPHFPYVFPFRMSYRTISR